MKVHFLDISVLFFKSFILSMLSSGSTYSKYCYFQTNAGAVMITDLVFWFILYPFLAHNQYDMSFVSIPSHIIGSLLSRIF